MTCKEKLKKCTRENTALLAANFYNFETLKGLLLAAQKTGSPLILQASESTLQYLGVKPAAALAKAMLDDCGVEGWLHLDHGSTVESLKECLDAGFDSVMIDASERPLRENIKITRRAVEVAAPYGANVEAELGYVAKLGQEQSLAPTSAAQAQRFTRETGVDALAVAIGNAHGFYKEAPKLDFKTLKHIRAATGCCLVLHGSSGIPDEQLQKAIQSGISKINLATEIKAVFMQKLQSLLKDNREIDLRKIFPKATGAVEELIVRKLTVINTADTLNTIPK